jgi:ribosomal protein S18 acetylase RimI-like enzyme
MIGPAKDNMPEVTTYFLEITSPSELRKPGRDAGVQFVRAAVPLPELNRFLYATVGRKWQWVDRLPWSREQWLAWLDRPELETHVAYVRGTPAGYFELESQGDGNIEVAYFGVIEEFIGQGVGGALLTRAVQRGFEMGARRVWLHTCTLDHPHALANYLARGFKVFREEKAVKESQPRASWPWHG